MSRINNNKTSSRMLFQTAVDSALDNSLLPNEILLPSKEKRNLDYFKNENDYNIIGNVYLNKNVNPYIVNYKVMHSLGDVAAESKDEDRAPRLAFGQYDFDGIMDDIDKNYENSINFARKQSESEMLDAEARDWWTKRTEYLEKKWNRDKRDSYMFNAQSWVRQTDDVFMDALEFAEEGVSNFAAAGWDMTVGWIPRAVNHFSLNLIENAYNMAFRPSVYADQKRIDKLPELEKKWEIGLPFTDKTLPSLAGFDGSINDYLGKNWTKIHQFVSNRVRDVGQAEYRSRLFGNDKLRRGAELFRDFWGFGKGLKQAKIQRGNYIVNNPKILDETQDILANTWAAARRDSGFFQGTAKYLRARNNRHNADFVGDNLKGRQMQRQWDMFNNTLAWTFAAEAFLYDSKFSSIEIPTNWIPLFEYDTPAGLLAAPVIAGAGTYAYTNTIGKVPQIHAHWQLGKVSNGWTLFTRQGLTGLNPFRDKMTMSEALNKYLLKSQRITPNDLDNLNATINKFNMEEAVIAGQKLKKGEILDMARNMSWGIEDYLYNEWLSGRISDPRRVEAMYPNGTDRLAIRAFNDKMEVLNIDRGTAKAQRDLFLLFDEMGKKGSPLAQTVLEWTKASIQSRDRIINALVDERGQIRPRYEGVLVPSSISGIYQYFDQMTNLAQASAYRRLITEAGDLGPLGNKVDSILYNDLLIMAAQEEQSLVQTGNVLNAVISKLDDTNLTADDPLGVFLKGAQKALTNQQEGYNNFIAELNTTSAQLNAIAEGVNRDTSLDTISRKLDLQGFDKPLSVTKYENTFNSLTTGKNKVGSTYEDYKKLGQNIGGISNARYEEVFGDDGIVSQAYNEARRKLTVEPDGTQVFGAKLLQDTLNELAIESGVNVINADGEIIFRGANEEGWAVQKHIVNGLKEAGIWNKYGVGRGSTKIPLNATVDDLISARSILNKMRWKDGVKSQARDIDIMADTITDVLNRVPGIQRANEIYQAYAKTWKNDFGASMRARQEGGNPVISDFNLMEEFIKWGIEEPQLAGINAFHYFGPQYKNLIAQGFAHGINNKRFTTTELDKADLFLKDIFSYNIKVDSQGNPVKSRIGTEKEKIRGMGGEIKTLINAQRDLSIELKLDSNLRKTETQKVFENAKASEIQLDKVMFAISGGEERVVPFIKDFSGRSVDAMNEQANTIIANNPDISIAEIKAGLLTGLKHTLMEDLVVGSQLSMKPTEKGFELDKKPTEGIPEGLAPKDLSEQVTSEPVVSEERAGPGMPQVFGGQGMWNPKGFVTFNDQNIIDQLNKKEIGWTDVLKGWNNALDTALLEYSPLIEFLSTGKGAVPYLQADVGLLKELSQTQRNLLNENLTLSDQEGRRPINIPRKWTAQQITGFINTYMKRITSRGYALGYAAFQTIRMRNARLQVRMFTDPNLNQSMSMAFSGEASQLDVNSRNAVIGAIIYSVPTVEELYPEEDNEEILAKYKNIRDAVIYEELQKYGLVTKKERVQQLTDIELMDLGVNYPGDKEVQAQIEALNLQ